MSNHEGRGSPVDATAETNCGKCELRDKCRDSRKSKRFACTFFVFEEDSKKLDASSRAFRKMMRELVSSETVLSDTYNIDDRDLPLAPNYYQWCVGEKYLAASPPPYPWQLEVGLHLFNDVCPNPKCTDKRWYTEIPHDCDVREIPERMSLRRRGVCPKCKKTRLDYINEGVEKDYNSYVGTVGQRCVTGDTLVTTTRGITRISDWARGLAPGWHEGPFFRRGRKHSLSVIGENGNTLRVSRIWVSKPERVHRVTVRGGLEITGTGDHPIMMHSGWKKLRDVRAGDVVPVYYGQRVWGSDRKLTPDRARFLGFWVSEGSGSKKSVHVTNYDDEVRALCRAEMVSLSPGAEIVERARGGVDPSLGLKRCVGSKDKLLYARVDKLVDGLWRKSADKVIPRSVLESPEHVVAAFLQALFEGDGYAGKRGVGYASLSKKLVMQIKVVLANMGIVTNIRKRMSWATNGTPAQVSKPYWSLGISGPALVAFEERVGFFSERKRAALRRAVERFVSRESDVPYWYDRYPEEIKRAYLELVARIDAEWSKYESVGTRGYTNGWVRFRYEVADWRRLESENVCLSRSRLRRYWNKLRASSRWYDLSPPLRADLLAFHDVYLQSNCYWTVVKKTTVSKKARKTYDFCVPEHHKFMANGLLNHNSGKCMSGSTLVATERGLVPIREVEAGDFVVVEGRAHRVLGKVASGTKPVIELRTKRGIVLKLTPDHKVLGPGGWVEARNARSVMICASSLPWGIETSLPPVDRKEKTLACALTRLTQEAARSTVQSMVTEYSVSGTDLVLKTRDYRVASALQQFLLTKNVIVRRAVDRLVLSSPWAARYADQFGIPDPRVEYVIRNAPSDYESVLSRATCESLYNTLQTVEVVDQWHDPSTLRTASEYRNICMAGELTRSDADACADAYEKLQPKDAFLRFLAVQRLRACARAEVDYDEVVSKAPAGREQVYDIEVEDVHRFVANGAVVHNSSGLGFIWSYHTHTLIKLKNPSAFYGIKAGTILHMNMIGLTYTGVKQAVWDPFMTTMSEAPWFKCIAEGEQVRMADGSLRSIQNVRCGERVRTLEGDSTVDGVFDNGLRRIVEMELSSGHKLRLTEDHKVRCVVGGELVWLPISSVNEDMMVVIENETDTDSP